MLRDCDFVLEMNIARRLPAAEYRGMLHQDVDRHAGCFGTDWPSGEACNVIRIERSRKDTTPSCSIRHQMMGLGRDCL